jgi:hypothetical protein
MMDNSQQRAGLFFKLPNAPYRPSIFISGALVFWTALCIHRELLVPQLWFGLVFTATTYAPTLFFAGEPIVQSIRRARAAEWEGHDAVATARTRARRALIIAATWVVTAIGHAVLRQWPDRFHVVHVYEQQVLCIVIFLALRHAFDERARKRWAGIELPIEDEERGVTQPALVNTYVYLPIPSSQTKHTKVCPRETATASNDTDVCLRTYRPSHPLLVFSAIQCILSFISEGLFIPFSVFTLPRVLQAIIPTLFFHIYMLTRQDSELTLQSQFIGDADFSLELTAIWFTTRSLGYFYGEYIPRNVEILLVSYMSVRYALGLWKTLPQYGEIL